MSKNSLPIPSFAIAVFSGADSTWTHFFGIYTMLMNERMFRIVLGAINAADSKEEGMEGRSEDLAEAMESILNGQDCNIQNECSLHRFGRTYQMQVRTEGLVTLKQALDDGSDDGYFPEHGNTLRAFYAQISNLLDSKLPVPLNDNQGSSSIPRNVIVQCETLMQMLKETATESIDHPPKGYIAED